MSQMPYRAQSVAAAVAAALSLSVSVSAEEGALPTYEITNLDELFSVKGTLQYTRNGYGAAISNGVAIGIAKGVNDGSTADDENLIDDVVDAILPENGITANSIRRPFIGNNFLFEHDSVDGTPIYVPLLENTPPVLNPDGDDEATPHTDAFYFGAGAEAFGLRIGSVTALQEQVANPNYNPTPEQEEDVEEGVRYDDDEFFFVREWENRAFVQRSGDPTDFVTLAPPVTSFVGEKPEATDEEWPSVTIGGISVAAALNDNGTVVGYASTELSSGSEERLQACYDAKYPEEAPEEGALEPFPLEVCIQSAQNSGNLAYQTRAYRWDLNYGDFSVLSEQALPMHFALEEDDTAIYTTQALGVNNAGWTVGRGQAATNPEAAPEDVKLINSSLWALAWNGTEKPTLIGPTREDSERIIESIAYDVNDNGIAVGAVRRYLSGYARVKFGWVDLNETPADGEQFTFTQPLDFFDYESDLSSRARSINNHNLVVGNIEIDRVRNLPRRLRAFIYDQNRDQFANLNAQLTCRARGLEVVGEGEDGSPIYQKATITDENNFSVPVTYEADIVLVDANYIDDDGNIVATALVDLPKVKTERIEVEDEEGNFVGYRTVIVTDEDGKPVVDTNANGEPTTNQVPRSVILRPLAVDDPPCEVPLDDGLNIPPNERQGAGVGFAWLLGLLPLAWLRRRRG
ncbi:DUF3466 family protein [Ferrimonas gelatinilytica]|uniref:DUF3466 family protein n=1 Tax=Ferrimonas gelatinilytica TaxID=1255257 RepID=A0ABP9RX59_9GAMM